MNAKMNAVACLVALLMVAPVAAAHGHATTLSLNNPLTGDYIVQTDCWIYSELGLEAGGDPDEVDYEGTVLEFYSGNTGPNGELGGPPFWDIVEFMHDYLANIDDDLADEFHHHVEDLAETVLVVSSDNIPDSSTDWERGNPDFSVEIPEDPEDLTLPGKTDLKGLVMWITECSG